ncbi:MULTISPECIES: hypothetical protein [Sphingomonadales]|uniref:Uncharacterized protein n=1 Tax=Novosphingobium soli TaxID=574956 RepID=A0ABV6D082_9SPHN|nr:MULTISPECIES: hypothetical protein [Sphingomonadaceae]MBB4049338.1 hypothetical protein [Sphingomonas zeae]MDV3481582.1 hypothetical protein [Sphingobium yanoikuyae]WBQ19682.1 hypothetical protein PAE53_26120 [Sphingobium yanoikuyae]WQE09722.1 hypothetical protein U0025_24730 [Sphingobium yanoikuyae]
MGGTQEQVISLDGHQNAGPDGDADYHCPMTAALHILWPVALRSIGAMQRHKVLVRSQCRRCGALMRVDLDDMVARHGSSGSLIDVQERCRMVACDGAAFYLASPGYGGPWRTLLGDPGLAEGLANGVAPVTAETLLGPTAR